MGTRHLIAVQKDGEYKVAQYGQWDGYFEGQGIDILEFLSVGNNIEKLKSSLSKVKWVSDDYINNYNDKAPDYSSDPDNRSEEQKYWFNTYISRDLGYDILVNISNSEDDEIQLVNSINFANNSLMCEYCYVVDFDKNTFEVFEGFNEIPLTKDERFYSKSHNQGYYPVKHIKTYLLNNLPLESDFLAELQPQKDNTLD